MEFFAFQIDFRNIFILSNERCGDIDVERRHFKNAGSLSNGHPRNRTKSRTYSSFRFCTIDSRLGIKIPADLNRGELITIVSLWGHSHLEPRLGTIRNIYAIAKRKRNAPMFRLTLINVIPQRFIRSLHIDIVIRHQESLPQNCCRRDFLIFGLFPIFVINGKALEMLSVRNIGRDSHPSPRSCLSYNFLIINYIK